MPIGIGYESVTLRAARRGGKYLLAGNESWSHILAEKLLQNIITRVGGGPCEHILAAQKHITIYLEWGIKFGALGENKGSNNRGCESQIWLKMRGESHPGKA